MLKHLQALENTHFSTTKVHVETSPDSGKHSFLTTKVHVETSPGSGKHSFLTTKVHVETSPGSGKHSFLFLSSLKLSVRKNTRAIQLSKKK